MIDQEWDLDLVELVTEVDRVNIIAFEVGKHDDLGGKGFSVVQVSHRHRKTYEEDHCEQQPRSHQHRKKEHPAYPPFMELGVQYYQGKSYRRR